jgi:arginine deiminase
MQRRAFLATAVMGGLASAVRPAQAGARPFVASDVAKLKSVMVHSPGPEVLQPPAEDDPELPPWLAECVWDEAGVAQHEGFVRALREEGVEVVEFIEQLDEAIRRARRAGRLGAWLSQTAPALADSEGTINAATLIGRQGPPPDVEDEEVITSWPRPLKSLAFLRDDAVMTPRGVVLTRFLNQDRALEMALIRLAFHASARLRRYPIVFDAVREQVYLQGGDLMVLDEKTLLLGVGNLTEPAAAPKLAKRLGMDVVTVALPGDGHFGDDVDLGRWDSLRALSLHLDSLFTLVDEKRGVVAPALLEAGEAHGRHAARLRLVYGRVCDDHQVLQKIGRVRTYLARTGEPRREAAELKLVDELKRRDIDCVEAGGKAPEAHAERRDWADHTVAEVMGQAANVVAVGPGRVVAYAENEATVRELGAAGVKVRGVPGAGMAQLHGGPHCLTMPLERA